MFFEVCLLEVLVCLKISSFHLFKVFDVGIKVFLFCPFFLDGFVGHLMVAVVVGLVNRG